MGHIDWAGQMPGVIVGAVAIVVSLGLWLGSMYIKRRSSRKALTYDYTTARIVSSKSAIASALTIKYGNMDVRDAAIISITVRNSGEVPIRRTDFDGNLTFTMPPTTLLLAVQISETTPPGLPVNLAKHTDSDQTAANSISIEPMLLNKGDRFELLALISEYTGNLEANARIEGISQVVRFAEFGKTQARHTVLDYVAMSLTTFGTIWMLEIVKVTNRLHQLTHPLTITVLCVTTIFIVTVIARFILRR